MPFKSRPPCTKIFGKCWQKYCSPKIRSWQMFRIWEIGRKVTLQKFEQSWRVFGVDERDTWILGMEIANLQYIFLHLRASNAGSRNLQDVVKNTLPLSFLFDKEVYKFLLFTILTSNQRADWTISVCFPLTERGRFYNFHFTFFLSPHQKSEQNISLRPENATVKGVTILHGNGLCCISRASSPHQYGFGSVKWPGLSINGSPGPIHTFLHKIDFDH